MLAGVLLHVVEASGPVDVARDRIAVDRRAQHVRDPLSLVDDVRHLGAAEPSGVVRLAAGGGVERRAVEVDSPAVVGAIDNHRLEGREI